MPRHGKHWMNDVVLYLQQLTRLRKCEALSEKGEERANQHQPSSRTAAIPLGLADFHSLPRVLLGSALALLSMLKAYNTGRKTKHVQVEW